MMSHKTIVALFVGILHFGLDTTSTHADDARPNVLVFIADDMAWDDCGAYGHPHIRTPNIDRLAKDGLKFHNAFLTCSSCSPSRSSIITGRWPHNTGARQLHQPLPAEQVTFPSLLKKAGYYTASAGKWHLGNATKKDFDLVVTRMNQWVKTMRERPQDKPFFMWFAFSDPHRGYRKNAIPKPHTNKDVVVPPYLPDKPAVRADLALYYDEITRLDGVVGNVLKELDKQGAAKNTMVVFLSDNGRPFPRCKTTVYDSGIKTPFIVKWPAKVKPGTTTDALISSIDLAPTILEAAGLGEKLKSNAKKSSFQGRSFLKVLSDPSQETNQYVFAEHNWHDFDDHGRAVRSKRFKYIRNYYTDIPGTPPADAVRSPTFQTMHKLHAAGKLTPAQRNPFLKPRPKEELYDVVNDPHELTNLAENSKYAKQLAKLRQVLKDWEKATNDRVPDKRRPDEFDRETGDRLKQFRRKRKR